MLRRIAPSLFQATVGETVTIAAIAQNNDGVESATFRYGSLALPTRMVGGHPGCDFVVANGIDTFRVVVLFSPNAPNARYDLFEEDDSGNLVDLFFPILSAFGPAAQFQVEGISVPVLASAKPKKAKKAKKAKKKTAKKKAAKKKTATKKKARTRRITRRSKR